MKNFDKKLIVLAGVTGVSLSAIFVTYATAPSPVLAFYRMGFAAVLLLPLLLSRHREELQRLPPKDILACVLSGFCLGGHFWCYFESLRFTSIAASTVLVNTEVFFVAAAARLLCGERAGKTGTLGILLAFGGSVLIALGDRTAGGDMLRGDLLSLLGAVFVALYTLIGRSRRQTMSTTVYTFIVYASAAFILLIACLGGGHPLVGHGVTNYAMALCMTLFCTFLGHSIFSWSLRYVSAVFVSTAKLGEPVFATLLGLVLLRQVPATVQVVGGIIILSGLALYTVSEGKRANPGS